MDAGAELRLSITTMLRSCNRYLAVMVVTVDAVGAGVYVTQSKRQMLNTDFTHVERLSLWTRQLHRGVALTIDLTGATTSFGTMALNGLRLPTLQARLPSTSNRL